MEVQNLFPVFNKSIADALILQGHKLIDKQPNKKYPWYKVFYFEKSNAFECAFYSQQVKHKSSKSNNGSN